MEIADREKGRKGVIVEYDFTALDGSTLLYDAVKSFLFDLDRIPFDPQVEATRFVGKGCELAFKEYFAYVKTKKTAHKAARDFALQFNDALALAIPAGITTRLKNFINALVARDVRVVLSTRAELEKVRSVFEPLLGENVILHQEISTTYGAVTWQAWQRACVMNGLKRSDCVALTGSGAGVRSALRSGMGVVALVHDRVAYQDYSGADAVVREFGAKTAQTVLRALKVIR